MENSLEELTALQRAADRAQDQAAELREAYGSPAVEAWTESQKHTYETAWRAWRDLDRDVQQAITHYAKSAGLDRADAERTVREQADHPGEPR